ncbi:TetR/AcrR family transcriptional regulator C-terminal domain-containing protein [Actinoplanes sp. NPDC051851]|uniref:TetR/AcrR family transcriptional regulator n=1 Tax=Actinoplanes sp. NPDC051851 TaxID=3154753 RepID=UPI00343474AF
MPSAKPIIWSWIARPGRSTRTIDYTAIIRAAIAIADREGLDAVSMRKVAARIDRGTMSLYRHVATRDDLIELMYDHVLGEVVAGLSSGPQGDWRTGLTRLARAMRALSLRHPWAAPLGSRPPLGPNALRILEYATSCVDGLGLTVDQMMDRVATTMQFTQGFVQAELSESEARRRAGLSEPGWQDWITPYLTKVLSEGNHPHLERIIRDTDDGLSQDTVFERRLTMVLDGLSTSLPR